MIAAPRKREDIVRVFRPDLSQLHAQWSRSVTLTAVGIIGGPHGGGHEDFYLQGRKLQQAGKLHEAICKLRSPLAEAQVNAGNRQRANGN
jgi:hypothetical protein